MGRRELPAFMGVKTREAAQHPVIHRTAPTTRRSLAQNLNSAEVEKICTSHV